MSKQDIVQQSADNAPVDLAVFDANYAAAKVSTDNQIPDAKYRVRVENVKLTQGSNGTSILNWDLRVMAGQFTGRHLFKHVAITAASLPIIKRDLLVLGLALAKFSSLPDHLESLAGKTLSATKRTKDGFVNVFFDKNL